MKTFILLSALILMFAFSSCSKKQDCLSCEKTYLDKVSEYNSQYSAGTITDNELNSRIATAKKTFDGCFVGCD